MKLRYGEAYTRSLWPAAVMPRAIAMAVTAKNPTMPSESASGTSPVPVNDQRNASIM